MADFNKHFSVSAFVSGICSGLLLISNKEAPLKAVLCFVLGIIGGLLPDIDSDDSKPFRISFNFIAFVFSFSLIFYFGKHYSISENILIWCISYFFIKFIFYFIFTKFTVHRGIIHSLPFGLIFSILITYIFNFLGYNTEYSYLVGSFIMIGYIVHLLLDEIYSFDIFSIPIKRSFGTAFKFYSKKNMVGSLILYLLIFVLVYYLPPPDKFVSKYIKSGYNAHFFPEKGWFQKNPFLTVKKSLKILK